MSSIKPVIVLVHGAWHRPSHWDNVVAKLREQGYRTEALALASATTTAIQDPLNEDVILIKEALHRHTSAGSDTVLVLHSYAGVCGSEAIAEYYQETQSSPPKGRILHLFYVAAIILPPGSNVIGDDNTPHVLDLEDGLLHHIEPYSRFYNTSPPSMARKCMAQIVPQCAESLSTNTKHAGWKDAGLPVTYLACKQDRSLEYDTDQQKFQKRLQQGGIADLSLRVMDCDHSPWLGREEEFMGILGEVLEKVERSAA